MQLAALLSGVWLLVGCGLASAAGAERNKCAHRLTFAAHQMAHEERLKLCETGCFDRYQLHSDGERATEGKLFKRFRCCCADYQVDKIWR